MSGLLDLRPVEECRFDVVALGEVMLRFDPGERPVRTARSFTVSEGGGEYNVGRALRRCFDQRVALVTALGDGEVGSLLEDLLLQGGVDLSHVVRKETDDLGRHHRTPLNFTERGFGPRASRGTYDRAHSACAALRPDDVDWDHIFGDLGARWLHTGGIFAGLSSSTRDVTLAAIAAARRHGTVVSYDVNYRPSLWADRGGSTAAEALTAELVPMIDVLFGVEPATIEAAAPRLPGPTIVASPTRAVRSASSNDWGGVAWSPADGVVRGRPLRELAVLDRVGGGDGFAAGVVFGLLTGETLAASVELGIAHGALVMSTPGDTSSADIAEVRRIAAGDDASVRR